MKKGINLILYLVIIAVVILLLWIIYSVLKNDNNDIVFKISNEKMEVKIGSNAPIDYEISDGLDVVWESNNSDVVKVQDGILTGVSLGNTMVRGTVRKGDRTITDAILVSTYYGDKEISLNNITVPSGELFITKGDSYQLPINYEPNNAYIRSIDYNVSDSNIASFSNGQIIAKNTGTTNIMITINQIINQSIIVNVIDKSISPTFSHSIQNVSIIDDNISLKVNESKKIDYVIEPNNAFIESIKWESSNPDVLVVNDGNILAKTNGEAIVKLTINDVIVKEIKVIVDVSVTGIKLESKSNISLKVGQSLNIKVSVLPNNATNKQLQFTSNNPSCVTVDNNGVMTAIGAGSGSIKIKTIDGDYSTSISFNVFPQKGIINGDGGIWGYKSSQDQIPKKADVSFFQSLASNGKGVLSNNIYTYTDNVRTYKYNISNSILSVDNRNILMRMYYPQNVDLSSVNTFTFFGGSGELKFGGYYNNIDKDPSLISTSGIVILVSARSSYDADDGILSTEFVRSIVGQKSGVKNTVGCYSMSGKAGGTAAEKGIYNRLIIFDSYFDYVGSSNNLKNKEIIVYSPDGDTLARQTASTINKMVENNYTNVTLVSNNKQLIDSFGSKILVINPGSQMGTGHVAKNILNANVYSFACS